MPSMIVIDLNARDTKCVVCGGDVDGSHGVPMLEGRLVSNDWRGPWVGVDSCRECHDKHASGLLRVHDTALSHYLPKKRLVEW